MNRLAPEQIERRSASFFRRLINGKTTPAQAPRRARKFVAGLLAAGLLAGCADQSAVGKLTGNQPQQSLIAEPVATAQPTAPPTVAPIPTQPPPVVPTVAPPTPAPPPINPEPQPLAVIPTPYVQPPMPDVEPCPVVNGRIDAACAAQWRRP